MIHKLLIIICLIVSVIKTTAQLVPGEWKDFLPYHMTNKVAVGSNRIYCCSPNSLFYYDLSDKSINRISKVQGLSDVEISTIEYSSKKNMLIIAYANSNIDILDNNNRISNLPYIKNNTSIADRRILNIMVVDNTAYLSCGFGIAVLDLDKLQIKDTYYPSIDGSVNVVNHTCTDGQYIYAATQTGIFRALIDDPFLTDYSRWSQFKNFPTYSNECKSIEYFAGKLFALYVNNYYQSGKDDSLIYLSDNIWSGLNVNNSSVINSIDVSFNKLFISTTKGIFSVDENLNLNQIRKDYTTTYATSDENGNVWISDIIYSLIEISKNGNIGIIEPNSPYYPDVYSMDAKNGILWTVAGSKDDAWAPMYNYHGAQTYANNTWQNYSIIEHPEFQNVLDIVNVKIDPLDNEKAYMAAWSIGGLIEYNHGKISFYKANNSALQPYFYPTKKSLKSANDTMYRVYGLSFDNSDNLWITNSFAKNQLLVFTSDGKWNSFYLGKTIENNNLVGDLVATSWGHKWIIIPKSTNIVVYDDNNTPKDASYDRYTYVNIANIKSTITSNKFYCITEDKQGNIWVGSDAGPICYTTPQEAFNNDVGTSPEKILVPIVKGKTEAAYLLETERINTIAVDGANRKWFGTQATGAYLISENYNQVAHFTSDNSPLLSNNILNITIDQKSGVVYFATDKGLISYKGFATEGGQDFRKSLCLSKPCS